MWIFWINQWILSNLPFFNTTGKNVLFSHPSKNKEQNNLFIYFQCFFLFVFHHYYRLIFQFLDYKHYSKFKWMFKQRRKWFVTLLNKAIQFIILFLLILWITKTKKIIITNFPKINNKFVNGGWWITIMLKIELKTKSNELTF